MANKLKYIGFTALFGLFISFTAEAHHGHGKYPKKKRTKVVVVNKSNGHCNAHTTVKTIRVMPRNHRVVVYNRVKYYHYNNLYYIFKNGHYVVVNPPKAVLVIR